LLVEFSFNESKQIEHKFTWATDFTIGTSAKLKLSYPAIASVELGGKVEEKISDSNTISRLITRTIQETSKPTCPPLTKLKCELKAKRSQLLIPYTANSKRIVGGRSYHYLINGNYSSDNYCSYCTFEEIITRNILLVGCTGSGKSTLAKVLSGDESFAEGSSSVSKTKFFKKSQEFEHQENYYSVIDNIGFGDTKLDPKEEMIRIGKAINSAYQGLSQVLFVFSSRFSEQEKEGIRKLAALKITNDYITLVRSKFDNFGNKEACERDKKALEEESSEMSVLINNCRDILHIDNGDRDSRDESRIKVLNCLHKNCEENPFKPKE
jgi:GTPase SAR1 family protein